MPPAPGASQHSAGKLLAGIDRAPLVSRWNGAGRGGPSELEQMVRQVHRWLSIAFTLVVIFNGVAVFKHRYTNWMGLLAVATLALMFFTGMYLFVLPYVTKWRSGRRAD